MKRLLVALFALLAAICAGVAFFEYQGARQADTAFAAEREQLRKGVWAAEKRAKALADELAATRNREPGPGGNSAATGTGGANRGPRDFQTMIGSAIALMDRPEIQRLMALQQKSQLDGRYAALFKSLNLSPDQLDKFKGLLVERQTAMLDVLAAARAQGIDPVTSPADFRKLVTDTQTDIDGEIRTALGDAGYDQYKSYEQTLPQRNVVTQLDQRLSYTQTPLSSAQYDQMVQILAATTPERPAGNGNAQFVAVATSTVSVNGPGGDAGAGFRGQLGGPMQIGGPMLGNGGTSPISNDAITQSQNVLTAPQVAALQQLQQEQQAQQQMGQVIRQNFQGQNGGGIMPLLGTPAPQPAKGGG